MKEDKEIILVSGPPGCGRHEYLQNVLQRRITRYYRVFNEIKEIGKKEGINITEKNISAQPNLPELRDNAFRKIKEKIKRSKKKYHIVSTPAIFYHNDWTKAEGLTEGSVSLIKPDIVIIFIDDLIEVKKRLNQHERWRLEFPTGASLPLLSKWREDSMMFLMKMYEKFFLPQGDAKSDDKFIKKIYVFGRQHPHRTLENLIYNSDSMLKIYLSYPITGSEKYIEGVKNFIKKLSDDFIVFDPYTIKDWHIVKAYDSSMGDKVNINGEHLERNEVERAIDSIRHQIVIRDFTIISSVDFIVVRHHSKEASSGVMAEIVFAQQKGKPVFGIYPFELRPSPFLEYFIKWGDISMLYTPKDLEEKGESVEENLTKLEDLLVANLKEFKEDLKTEC